ncbi:hypothetical protein JMJ77_0002094 [Colletotrichum scovillei]|uniref:Uncharacterized protein n=1 Tax=Colletotrichum scovillei TaxID=1209932 RepID=A0A9P7R8X5_9PEZI|nr:hypothetical protein JMJ77_0002094 [Colletotrichum scovillei]KAG7070509.1 hypothetical protein JMJ76_0001760 [Colletotrichum scovillei]KAG7078757.1 hypothetical protein JMJ78_0002424 [Colletotrichum scovillei]
MQNSATAEKKTKTKKKKNMCLASSKTMSRTLALTEQKHSCLRNNSPTCCRYPCLSDRKDGPVPMAIGKQILAAFDIWQPEPEPLPAGDLFDVLPGRMPLVLGRGRRSSVHIRLLVFAL